MQRLLFIALFSLFSCAIYAQESNWAWMFEKMNNTSKENAKKQNEQGPKDRLVRYEVIDGDTIPIIDLPDVVVMDMDYKRKYDDNLYYIKRMYPYAKLIAQIKKENDSILAATKKRGDRRDYLDARKELVFAQFEDAVKKMSINEGKFLVKLIHRECGETAYDVISDYLGEVKTFMWQTASRLGGANLKLEYDPTGDDKIMEDVMRKVDKGEIRMRKIKLDEKAIEKRAAEKRAAKQKKKEERKKK